jgi:Zn-dependent membrane protease YugP
MWLHRCGAKRMGIPLFRSVHNFHVISAQSESNETISLVKLLSSRALVSADCMQSTTSVLRAAATGPIIKLSTRLPHRKEK